MRQVLLAVALLTSAVFAYQKFSSSDPEVVAFGESRDAAATFVARNCRDIGCDFSQGTHGLYRSHYQTPEGWVWVFRTKGDPGETHVLFPVRNPRDHRIVQRPTE